MYLNHKILGNYNRLKIQFKFNKNLMIIFDRFLRCTLLWNLLSGLKTVLIVGAFLRPTVLKPACLALSDVKKISLENDIFNPRKKYFWHWEYFVCNKNFWIKCQWSNHVIVISINQGGYVYIWMTTGPEKAPNRTWEAQNLNLEMRQRHNTNCIIWN